MLRSLILICFLQFVLIPSLKPIFFRHLRKIQIHFPFYSTFNKISLALIEHIYMVFSQQSEVNITNRKGGDTFSY